MEKTHAGNRDLIMSNLKDKSVKLAILCLILLDIFLVLYSCENRQRFNPSDNSMPIVTSAKLPDMEEPVNAVVRSGSSLRNEENAGSASLQLSDNKTKVTAYLEK
jgi:hypothetical protein